jgi:hypothetical protein
MERGFFDNQRLQFGHCFVEKSVQIGRLALCVLAVNQLN